MRQINFMQGNVISSEYTINEYIHNVPRQELKKPSMSTCIMHINRIVKSMCHYNKNLVIQYIVHDWLRYSSTV